MTISSLNKNIMASGTNFDAFELLHPRAWLEVFKRVDDPKDLYSLYNTCFPFHNLLEPKWSWGFSLILPHIAPHLSIKRTKEYNHYVEEQISDQDWNGLLQYRLICKDWSLAVVDFLSSPPWDLKTHAYEKRHRIIHDFNCTDIIQEFQEIFGTWEKNPFPSRTVAFSPLPLIWWGGVFAEYQGKMIEIVEVFGTHIHTLILGPRCFPQPEQVETSWRENCELIRTLLSHLPNLKRLFLPYLRAPRNQQEIANYYNDNPLPPLLFLDDLHVCWNCGEFYYFFLQRYGAQLKSVSELSLLENNPTTQLVGGLTQAKELALCLDPKSKFDCLRDLHSPLKRLSVHAYGSYDGNRSVFHIDKFLQAIRHLPIQELRLTTYRTDVKESGQLSLADYKNDNVRFFSSRFALRGPEQFHVSFNFLQSFVKVEFIRVSFVNGEGTKLYRHPHGTPENIRLYPFFPVEGFEGDPFTKMYESDIWEKLGSLNTLHVQGSISTTHYSQPEEEVETMHEQKMSFTAWYSRNVYDRLKI